MTVKTKLEWRGKEAEAAMREARRRGLEAAAMLVEGNAVLRCPVKTGNLRSSINHQLIDDETAIISTPVEYGPAVELGIGQRPQPFLQPALDENVEKIKRLFDEILSASLKKV